MNILELEDFEDMTTSLSKCDACDARLLFWAIKDDLDELDLKKEFENFVSGVRLIEFVFLSQQIRSETYRVKFARIRGFDLDVKREFEDFKVYAKEYVDGISKKIGIPIKFNEEISNK